MISDEALMLEFQAGSREAFEELFARYRDPLYGFFRRRLEAKERADDHAGNVSGRNPRHLPLPAARPGSNLPIRDRLEITRGRAPAHAPMRLGIGESQ